MLASMSEALQLRPDGFRERGGQVTRLDAFVDAAYAFALTMLVISVGSLPDSMPKLLEALKGTPAFAASFAQIAYFWYAHVTWSRRYGLDDLPTTVLSLVMVFLVLVYIYPLRALFATFFSWIGPGWLPIGFALDSMVDVRMMFVVYGLVFGTMGLSICSLYLHAWRRRDDLELTLHERIMTVEMMVRWLIPVAFASLSIAAALSLPEHPAGWATGLPGVLYLLMAFAQPIPAVVGRRFRRHLMSAHVGSVGGTR